MAELTTDRVWQVLEKELFAVLGMVTARGEARTVGVIYGVRDRKLYIATRKDAWKARHVAQNPHVSITIPIAKRIPLLPWFKIPAATITFQGEAQVMGANSVDADILSAIFRGMVNDEELLANSSVIVVTPVGEFITYGVGVSLMQMRDAAKARGRVATAEEAPE